MRKIGALAAIIATLSACSLFTAEKSLSPEAHVAPIEGGCRLAMNGMFPAVHTLSPGDKRYMMEALIEVPNLTGPFRAEEVRVMLHGERNEPYEIRYLSGTMAFSEGSVSIAFEQTQPGKHTTSFPFNGTYSLANKEACA